MMQNADRTIEQFQKLLTVSEQYFTPERHTLVVKMYDVLQERVGVAPASSHNHFHNCYPGGYIDHILNVIAASKGVVKLFAKMGGTIDFTKEEMIFTAMHHDLGKLGDEEYPYYIPQTSDWHRKNRGEVYKINPKIPFMRAPERALYLLQRFGISVTKKEYYAIRLSDGMFDESNRPFFFKWGQNPDEVEHFTNLHLVISWADHMAATCEKNHWERANEGN